MADKNVVIENARITFRNFSGKEGKWNPAGKRNFCVLLEEKLAKEMLKDGYNVRELKPREEGDPAQPYLQVAVNYGAMPPKIVLITSNGKTTLSEEEVGMLDWVEIENADLIIRPYNWEVNDKKGTKAYTKALYITIVEDEFAKKYSDIPDGMTPAEPIIANEYGLTIRQLRDKVSIAKEEQKRANIAQVYRYTQKGYSNRAIAEAMGVSESTVRSWKKAALEEKTNTTDEDLPF